MQYISNEGNEEVVFDVHCDKERLKRILDLVVREASYRTKGDFKLDYLSPYKDGYTPGDLLVNGDPMYQNITCSYPGEYLSGEFYVRGEKVTTPLLANIIKDLIDEKDGSYEMYLNYASSEELLPIDARIDFLDEYINGIDNFDYDEKIDALTELKKLCETKNNKQYFNDFILLVCYGQVKDCIRLDPVEIKSHSRVFSNN